MSANYYETDEYIFFYGSAYSQWAMRDIKIGGEVYNCNEQYMMAKKAELFNDFSTLAKIMRTFDPSDQKRLGRQVKNFDKDEWEVIAKDVVYDANYAKFTQHKDLRKQLVDSEDKIIVEASPTDCIWGIGMSCDDPGIFKPENWRGTNWLGEAIMKVRGVIMSNSGQFSNDELVFKWTSKNGTAAVSPLTDEELKKLLNG